MRLRFLGANRQVTGSCYMLEADGLRILVDCGMFQERKYLERNWAPFPVPADSIDVLLLTHAHLDHSGLIPKLVREGFAGRILSTAASVELAKIILEDAAKIQQEDAEFKRKRHAREGRKGPRPIEPLYTDRDVKTMLPLFEAVSYGEAVALGDSVSVTYHDAGHILGSAMLQIGVGKGERARTIVFSGDIGQWDKPIIRDPTLLKSADYVVMESTYGGSNHKNSGSVEDQLCDAINTAVEAGGNLVIPTFAVERAQELMYHVARLVHEDRIPHLLLFLDSPMAVNVTEVFRRHREYMDEEAQQLIESGEGLFRFPGLKLVRTTQESKAINRIRGSCVIMAGSGMCTAGRVKHHLVQNIEREQSTILFVGYQAHGTLGRQIVDGKPTVRILGAERQVRARIARIDGLSAHADQDDLLRWLGSFGDTPRRVFLTHGEESSATALAEKIRGQSSVSVEVPDYQDTFDLD